MNIELALIAILFLLLFLSGWISASEAALFSLPEMKLSTWRLQGRGKEKQIAELLLRPQDLLVTIFIANTIVNILLQNTCSSLVGDKSSLFVKVGFPFIITLILGEILPKYYGIQNNLWVSKAVSSRLQQLQNLFAPFRKAIVAITHRLSRTLFFFLKKSEPLNTKEIELFIKTSVDKGVLTKGEEALLQGVLHLQNSPIKELMWPRKDIIAYDVQEPIAKLSRLFVDEALSRIPVIDTNLEHVLGFIEAPLFFCILPTVTSGKELENYLQKPLYVPENISAKTLLDRLHQEKAESALVVDEYGIVSGLITEEDLIEVVVGPIFDTKRDEAEYTLSLKKELICSASLQLKEFNELYGTDLYSKVGFTSLGGWITEQTNDIPRTGVSFDLSGFRFHILSSEPTHIEKIFVRRLPHG